MPGLLTKRAARAASGALLGSAPALAALAGLFVKIPLPKFNRPPPRLPSKIELLLRICAVIERKRLKHHFG